MSLITVNYVNYGWLRGSGLQAEISGFLDINTPSLESVTRAQNLREERRDPILDLADIRSSCESGQHQEHVSMKIEWRDDERRHDAS